MVFLKSIFTLELAIAATTFLVGQVAGHGRMLTPQIRFPAGDDLQDFSLTNGPTNRQPCAGNAPGAPKTTYTQGQEIPIKWLIKAPHLGTCNVDLSITGQDTDFTPIGSFADCAGTTGTFDGTVKLPAGVTCEHCTVRFRWEAELGDQVFLNCADVAIVGPTKAEAPKAPEATKDPEKPAPEVPAPQPKKKSQKKQNTPRTAGITRRAFTRSRKAHNQLKAKSLNDSDDGSFWLGRRSVAKLRRRDMKFARREANARQKYGEQTADMPEVDKVLFA